MPALSKKHEEFAQAVALGMPASQAYFEKVSGGKCSEATAETTGPKLARDSQVALRITELKKGVAKAADEKFALTRETWLERLEGIATQAEESEEFNAATSALREIGKAAGWYEPEKHEVSGALVIPGLSEAVTAVFGRK